MSSNRILSRVRSISERVQWLPPLVLRIVLGVTFTLAGWGKLHNLDKITAYFASLGIPAASIQAPMIATLELVGGLLLIAGLGTRVVSLLLMSTLVTPSACG
ncbi:MAG: DoxX family protein, partial [Rhodoglobus sp.]